MITATKNMYKKKQPAEWILIEQLVRVVNAGAVRTLLDCSVLFCFLFCSVHSTCPSVQQQQQQQQQEEAAAKQRGDTRTAMYSRTARAHHAFHH